MDSPGHEGEGVTGMVGGCEQVVVFTSGRGTSTCFSFFPGIKVTSERRTLEKMRENIDLDASPIIDQGVPIDAIGEEIFQSVLETASGTMTKAELLGHGELFCITRK